MRTLLSALLFLGLVTPLASAQDCELSLLLKKSSTQNDGPELSTPAPKKSYYRSDRGFHSLKKIYPEDFLEISSFENKTILDAGCGAGRFVWQLREKQIKAFGVDLLLDFEQANSFYFFKADLRKTPFADRQFDLVFSTFSVFTGMYEGENQVFLTEALLELKRVTKVNGLIRIGAGNNLAITELVEQKLTGLRVARSGSRPDDHIELQRIAE